MKIAFVSQPFDYLTTSPSASVTIWTLEVARRLAQQHDVLVYAQRAGEALEAGPGATRVRPQPAREVHAGVAYYRVPVWFDLWACRVLRRLARVTPPRAGKPLFSSPLYYVGYAMGVARDLRGRRRDVVHIQNFSQLAPVIRARAPDARIVLHMHCEWLTQLDRAMITHRLRSVDWVIGCSEHVTRGIREAFPFIADRCRTVYNGVDVARFASRIDHDSIGGAARILYVGRIAPEKGLDVLLHAFPAVLAAHPDTTLEIVGPEYRRTGTDSYQARLRNGLAPEVAGRVRFAGEVDHTELPGYYNRATVFVTPSLHEAFGMTLIEAMAMERPVVAARSAGAAEVIGDSDAGLLVEPGDAVALAAALNRLLADQSLRVRMGQAGRRRVNQQFSWDQVARSLLDVYGAAGVAA